MRMILLVVAYHTLLTPNLVAYRKMLERSVDNKKVANEFYEQFKPIKEDDVPVLIGFKAMSEFMLCKHLLNPLSRLSHFNKGRDLLEEAIKREPASPELLFFRFTTQSTIPSLLNYSDKLKEDKLILINYLKQGEAVKDKDLFQRVKAYMLINKYCSAAEKALIKNL